MVAKGDRSKRRRPRTGFPHPVTGYLDQNTHRIVSKAAEQVGESVSTFVARAVEERAASILNANTPKH
jgi:predicted HicB family RNase H-like nuclease